MDCLTTPATRPAGFPTWTVVAQFDIERALPNAACRMLDNYLPRGDCHDLLSCYPNPGIYLVLLNFVQRY